MEFRKMLLVGALMMTAVTVYGCGAGKETSDTNKSKVVTGGNITVDNHLKDGFKNDFSVGVAINTYQLEDENDLKVIKENFNSITMENEMKPENMLNQEGSVNSTDKMPAINKDKLDQILKLAKDNGLKLRGHTLVWHNQTPAWFFCENYDESQPQVDKATLLLRMESYIKQMITYCQDNYPGVVYAWDVVNEAMGDAGGYRTEKSMWYTIIGEEFVEKAFEYANKYADPKVKLFYNDYNCYEPAKRDFIYAKVKDLAAKKLIDGIGMQSHWIIDYPSVELIQTAVEKYGELGLELQMTEIDMHTTDNSAEALQAQAERYKEIFKMFLAENKDKKANITNVTFWGLNDDVTWLTDFKGETSYPLLFNGNNQAKPVVNSLLEAAARK